MSETIEGVDLSPDQEVRVSWGIGLVDLMTHTSVSPLHKRYPPAHWNPDPMFGLRTPHDWFFGERATRRTAVASCTSMVTS